jgi:hypothetical protein
VGFLASFLSDNNPLRCSNTSAVPPPPAAAASSSDPMLHNSANDVEAEEQQLVLPSSDPADLQPN